MAQPWKKGRGKLGVMAPLLGRWKADADTPMGPVRCIRDLQKFGDGYVRLEAEWTFGGKGAAKTYRELCLFGPDKDGALTGAEATRRARWSCVGEAKHVDLRMLWRISVYAMGVGSRRLKNGVFRGPRSAAIG